VDPLHLMLLLLPLLQLLFHALLALHLIRSLPAAGTHSPCSAILVGHDSMVSHASFFEFPHDVDLLVEITGSSTFSPLLILRIKL
jgi:hypothetical protein